jgi:hypothetical protein
VGSWRGKFELIRGQMTQPNGNIYEGEFVNRKYEGRGKLVFYSSNNHHFCYDGNWKNGLRHGFGVEIGPNVDGSFNDGGTRYEGTWVNNRRHGNFKCKDSNNKEFQIVYENGQRTSQIVELLHRSVLLVHFSQLIFIFILFVVTVEINRTFSKPLLIRQIMFNRQHQTQGIVNCVVTLCSGG